MGTRRKSRELAMQMLFQGDLGKQKPDEVESLFWDAREDVDDETKGFEAAIAAIEMASIQEQLSTPEANS